VACADTSATGDQTGGTMNKFEVMRRERHRQKLIAMIRPWLPQRIQELFDELLKLT